MGAVWKHSNDSLEECEVKLGRAGLEVRAGAAGEGRELGRHRYQELAGLTLRARPFHCDIGLREGGGRIRLACSDMQLLTNELALRVRDLPVSWERNAIRFEYGSPLLREGAPEEYGYVSDAKVRAGFR